MALYYGVITLDKVLQTVHSIREADLRTHDELDGIGQDACYEEYLMCKMREAQMINIKAKYQELEEKKKKKKFKITLQGIEAFILAICVIQLIAFLALTQKGKTIQYNIQEQAVDAVYNSIVEDDYTSEKDNNNYLSDLFVKGLQS